MAETDANDFLNFIEAQAQMADTLDGLKQQLVTRGWNDSNAEQASIAMMVPMMVSTFQMQMQMKMMGLQADGD